MNGRAGMPALQLFFLPDDPIGRCFPFYRMSGQINAAFEIFDNQRSRRSHAPESGRAPDFTDCLSPYEKLRRAPVTKMGDGMTAVALK